MRERGGVIGLEKGGLQLEKGGGGGGGSEVNESKVIGRGES